MLWVAYKQAQGLWTVKVYVISRLSVAKAEVKLQDLFPQSTNGKLVVWVGGLDSWDRLMKGIVT